MSIRRAGAPFAQSIGAGFFGDGSDGAVTDVTGGAGAGNGGAGGAGMLFPFRLGTR